MVLEVQSQVNNLRTANLLTSSCLHHAICAVSAVFRSVLRAVLVTVVTIVTRRKGSKKRKRLPAIVDSNWAKLSKTIGAAVKSVPAPPPKPAGDKPPHSKHTLTHSEYIKAPVPPELMNSGRNPAAIVSKYLGLDCEMVCSCRDPSRMFESCIKTGCVTSGGCRPRGSLSPCGNQHN
jgi:hypothetical protein